MAEDKFRKTLRSFLMLLLALVSVEEAVAQHSGFTELTNLVEFKKKFAEEGKKILSIRSSFRQEKTLSMLEEKIISEGKFNYKREKKVRLEYQKPFRYLLIINGDQLLIRDDQKESRISASSSKLFQQINRIIVDCVNGAILDNKDFSPRVFQNEKMYLLEMSPTSKAIKDFFQKISVLVDKKDWTVVNITLLEPGSDNTIILFTDKVIND
ncbi:MAG TPA: outer membrane lipoprotein carrier protein LolA, partial [Chitinophagaceae bacterium]|nr:outer membrane lipoprotein carrier protein LolA [Chitinophagaceae bacterium]